jgi:hypothetical protein
MRAEYDFRDGIRGKHHEVYRQGHAVEIHKEDGTVDRHYFTLEEGAVMLEPDVRKYFPDSESVNRALRSLIDLIPDKQKAVADRKGSYQAPSE